MKITLKETPHGYEAKYGLRFDEFITSMKKDQQSLSGIKVTRTQFESVARLAARRRFGQFVTLTWID
jgi:hypothetical protein